MIWPLLGGIGQTCFVLRVVAQWRAAEQAGRSVVPRSFWWLSLGGALLMVLYSLAVQQVVLAGGYLASAWIYARNLALCSDRSPRPLARILPEIALVLAILALSGAAGITDARRAATPSGWLFVLLLGQLLWSSRFLLQWLASERKGRSHLPEPFWWLSLAGNALLLAYSLHLVDPLLVCAFAFGPVVQVRNLVLARRRSQVRPHAAGLPLAPSTDFRATRH